MFHMQIRLKDGSDRSGSINNRSKKVRLNRPGFPKTKIS